MNAQAKKAAKKVARNPSKPSLRVTKTMSLDHETYEAVKRRCAADGITISSLMDDLLEAWLAEVEGV